MLDIYIIEKYQKLQNIKLKMFKSFESYLREMNLEIYLTTNWNSRKIVVNVTTSESKQHT